MKRAILTVGISASGKTTWAEQFVKDNAGWKNINRDVIRHEVLATFPNDGPMTGVFWTDWNAFKCAVTGKRNGERIVTDIFNDCMDYCIADGDNIIVSDTNLNPKFRNALITKLEAAGYTVELKKFPIGYHEAVKRDAARKNPVGANVIGNQLARYRDQFGNHVATDTSLPNCYIVDVDGTLATMNGRSPFDWSKVIEDLPNWHVVHVVNALINAGYHIVFMSGRDSVCRGDTLRWLCEHFPFLRSQQIDDNLHMRAAGDNRPDTVIKRELFDAHVWGKYNVIACIDDRPRVCEMWREMGLDVLQAGSPYVDF